MSEQDRTLADDDVRFDRLVDGDLSPEEYRALVASLDHEADGWRNCALAFLESQALADELGGARRALDLGPTVAGSPAPLAIPQPIFPGLRTLLAMAASFAIVFALGVTLPRIWHTPLQEAARGGNLLAPSELTGGFDGIRHEVNRPIGNVRLVVNGAGGEETDAELPVYEIGQNLDEYLEQSQPGLDPWVLWGLEQQGYQVEMEQQYIPGQLADGRPMYVPVEQYRITPVKRSY